MGSICDKVDEEFRERMHRHDPVRCKHGSMIEAYGCWYCKTEERIERIEKALGIEEDG